MENTLKKDKTQEKDNHKNSAAVYIIHALLPCLMLFTCGCEEVLKKQPAPTAAPPVVSAASPAPPASWPASHEPVSLIRLSVSTNYLLCNALSPLGRKSG